MFHVRESHLRFVVRPTTTAVTIVPPGGAGALAMFISPFFEVEGQVSFAQPPAKAAGCRLGFTQLQWIETNRATFRGIGRGDGWSMLKRDRAPARPAQACRDVAFANDVFSYPPGAQGLVGYMPRHKLDLDLGTMVPLPTALFVSHADAPRDIFPTFRRNGRTGKLNYLDWAQLEFHFCTVMLLRRNDGTLHQLKHFYWNVHWNANFTASPGQGSAPATVRPLPSAGRNIYNFGRVIDGAVTDSRFAALIGQAVTPTCNTVAGTASANQIVTEGV